MDMAAVPTMNTPSLQQFSQARQIMQPTRAFPPMPLQQTSGVRMNAPLKALPTSGLSASDMSQNRAADVRQFLTANPAQKCVYVNQHASLCGSLVVLRPATSLRAESKESSTLDADGLVKELTEKWDAVEDKPQALLYAGAAVAALVFSNSILSTVNAIPLLPKLLEVVGLGYTGWFTYRYLLFKSSREELVQDIEELKKRVSGGD